MIGVSFPAAVELQLLIYNSGCDCFTLSVLWSCGSLCYFISMELFNIISLITVVFKQIELVFVMGIFTFIYDMFTECRRKLLVWSLAECSDQSCLFNFCSPELSCSFGEKW